MEYNPTKCECGEEREVKQYKIGVGYKTVLLKCPKCGSKVIYEEGTQPCEKRPAE
jgi:predicted RNA-binding Zn-ribbon protein involved in translation (DUF1610 family)